MCFMKCKKCQFFCCEDELICPACDCPIYEKFPATETERLSVIRQYIAMINQRKRKSSITKKFTICYIAWIFFNIIIVANTVLTSGFSQSYNYRSAFDASYMFVYLLFLLLIGVPYQPLYRFKKNDGSGIIGELKRIRKNLLYGSGVVRSFNIGRTGEVFAYLFMGIIIYFMGIIYAKPTSLHYFTKYLNPEADISFYISAYMFFYYVQYFSCVVFYLIGNIFNLTYYEFELRTRLNDHKKSKK